MKENLFVGFVVLVFVAIFAYLLVMRSPQGYQGQDVRNWCNGPDGGLVPCAGTLSAQNGDRVGLGGSYLPQECAVGLTWDGSACRRNGEIPNDLYGVGCPTC